jgi:hypothetical protein
MNVFFKHPFYNETINITSRSPVPVKRSLALLKKMPITPKVFLLTFICFEALIVLLALSFNNHSSSILVESQMNDARQTVRQSNRYLDLNMQNIFRTMSSIVNDNRLQNGDYGQLEKWITSLISLTPNLRNIHLVSDGSVLASSSTHSWVLKDDPIIRPLLSNNYSSPVWIGPYYSKVSGYTLTYVSDIKLKDGITGILMADVNLELLYHALSPNDSSGVSP